MDTLRKYIRQVLKEEIEIKNDMSEVREKAIFKIPEIPDTMNFWHGGSLDNKYENNMAQKNGQYEYGLGLYLTTKFEVA
jgi:hypothetical protein